jgi:hypothetical protein
VFFRTLLSENFPKHRWRAPNRLYIRAATVAVILLALAFVMNPLHAQSTPEVMVAGLVEYFGGIDAEAILQGGLAAALDHAQ